MLVFLRKILDRFQSFACCHGISSACFIGDELRDEKLESALSLLPPTTGDLLIISRAQRIRSLTLAVLKQILVRSIRPSLKIH
jgi:hypothetical protein